MEYEAHRTSKDGCYLRNREKALLSKAQTLKDSGHRVQLQDDLVPGLLPNLIKVSWAGGGECSG